ncbi:MAG: glycerate kinase [Desulfobacterales bacterium]|jgi:hydroxypyruvate reductase
MNSKSKDIQKMRGDAVSIFNAGLKAVEPGRAVRNHCRVESDHLHVSDQVYDLSMFKNLFVIGAGKASAPMAAAIENLFGERITAGIINVKYGHTAELERVKLVEAGHPVPDENGEAGSRAILDLASDAGRNDLILCLMSGGGSALLPLAAEGLNLKDKQDTIKVLLACGATIHEINAIRKHTSSIKGGRLARAAYPATLISLILSDVVGDDLDVIASGPTVADSSTFGDCMEIFRKYQIIDKLPGSVVRHIEAGISGKVDETPKTGDRVFLQVNNIIVGSNFEAISAAEKKAKQLAYHTLILSSMIEGETKHVAHVHGAIAREILKTGNPLPPPACILSGGETTVTITGKGRGGRSQEFALAAAMDICESDNIVVLCGGTDGTDGPTDAAGAMADSGTITRAAEMGMDPRRFLSDNDSYSFFKTLEDLFITGPTNTNVMDLRITLVV